MDRASGSKGRSLLALASAVLVAGSLAASAAGASALICSGKADGESALWRPTPDAPGPTISVAAAVEELGAWVAAAQQAGGSGAVAILDARPERSVSCLFRRWLAELGCGAYVLPFGHSSSALDGMLHEPIGALGVDLGRVRTVLSFGAPILAGWTAPGRVMWRRRAPDHGFTLIQAESRPSTTALQAERWLQPRPGSDTALAFGIAHVILAENLHMFALLRLRQAESGIHALLPADMLERVAAHLRRSCCAQGWISRSRPTCRWPGSGPAHHPAPRGRSVSPGPLTVG